MNGKRMLGAGLGIVLAVASLSACGQDTPEENPTVTEETAAAETSVDVADDLESARQVVLDALAEDDSWEQIMLASDVDSPTVKYGLLVVPFVASDAADRVQGTVTINDGAFTIEAVSAATGDTFVIDQDGEVTQADD